MTSLQPNIWYIHPYAGGPGVGRLNRPFELGRRWVESGARVTVFTASYNHAQSARHPPGITEIAGLPYVFVPAPEYSGNGLGRVRNMITFSANMWQAADRYVRLAGQPTAVIASSPHPYAFVAAHAIARRSEALSIFEVRDLWPASLVELADVSRWHPLVLFTAMIERMAYSRADHVVSLLPRTLDYMKQRGLADESRWHYVPNGVGDYTTMTIPVLSPPFEHMKRLHADDRVVVIYAGAIGRPNNVGTLVDAMAEIIRRGDRSIKALIVGDGEEKEFLYQRVIEMGLENEVVFYSGISRDAAICLIRSADIGYISLRSSSIFQYGISPNKLLDYMMCGLPVVQAISAANNPVDEAACGITVPSANPDEVASALQALAAMGRRGRQQVGAKGQTWVTINHDYGMLADRYLAIAESNLG